MCKRCLSLACPRREQLTTFYCFRYVAFPKEGLGSGAVTGITLAGLVGAGIVVWGLVLLKRRRSDRKWREAHQVPLAQNAVEP